ncbi:hypothetical protein EDD86DRAFT_250401 [Gorgonomyces haynaldii]|nr:hypothetical protein EDD86DRAFT_250401 [Gorgonomyces haynaldii]
MSTLQPQIRSASFYATALDITNQRYTGPMPPIFDQLDSLFFSGNSFDCRTLSKLQKCTTDHCHHISPACHRLVRREGDEASSPGAITGFALFGICIVMVIFIVCKRRKRSAYSLRNEQLLIKDLGDQAMVAVMSEVNLADFEQTSTLMVKAHSFVNAYGPNSPKAIAFALATSEMDPSSQYDKKELKFYERSFNGLAYTGYTPTIDIWETLRKGEQYLQFVTPSQVSIQTRVPMRVKSLSDGILYQLHCEDWPEETVHYDCKVIELSDAVFCVGLASCPYPPFRLPGQCAVSICVRSTGTLLVEAGHTLERQFCKFGPGDTVTCGYSLSKSKEITVFFRIRDQATHVILSKDDLNILNIYPICGADGNCSVAAQFY